MLTDIQIPRMKALVADLRANVGLQGKNALRTLDDHFCCLGRACELSGLGTWDKTFGENEYIPADGTQTNSQTLPPAVRDWYGFPKSQGFSISARSDVSDYSTVTLAACNDDGLTFPQIADLIEYKFNLGIYGNDS